MNNYFIIHGSFSYPYSNWFKWVYESLSDKNSVYVPSFPIGVGFQNYKNWEKLLKYYFKLGLINSKTIVIAHSIAPVFICKFLIKNKIKINKIISVCGFNNYLGINKDYDNVNKSMYLKDISKVKYYANEIICFYSNNDPYVKYYIEKDFADEIATKHILIKDGGHINSESGYFKFEEILKYI
jgi:predicted alpha/beta hydrolase family esterase